MRWGCRRLGLGLVLAAGLSCTDASFECLDDAACAGLNGGRCEATGFCSQSDDDCESGHRYAAHAGTLAGSCVAPSGTSSGLPPVATSTAADTASPTSTAQDTSDASTTGAQTTSVVEDETSSTDPSTETSDGPGSSSTGGPPLSPYDFEDDFERPDSDIVGNGWREKTDGAFALVDGTMRRGAAETGFPDNLVYRPGLLAEGIEVHTTFRFLGDDVAGFPQVHVRIDEATSEAPGPTTGYVLYLPDGVLNMVRVDEGMFTELGTASPDVPVEVGTDYRFRFSVSAEATASLDAYLDQRDGETWTQIAEVHSTDAQPLPAGTVGLSGHVEAFRYAYEHIGWFTP